MYVYLYTVSDVCHCMCVLFFFRVEISYTCIVTVVTRERAKKGMDIYIYMYKWNSDGMCHPDTGNAPKVLRILARDNMRVDRRRKRKHRAFFLFYIYMALLRARTHKLTLTSHNWPDTIITLELPRLAYVRIYTFRQRISNTIYMYNIIIRPMTIAMTDII